MWYDINCRDRILEWRRWRQHLDGMDWHLCLEEVARAWHLVPRINHYLSPDLLDDWPNPWELINDNHYCDLAIALGIFYTLSLTSHKEAENIKLEIYRSHEGFDNLCIVDERKYCLNWSSGKVVNIPTFENKNLAYSYSKEDLKSKLG